MNQQNELLNIYRSHTGKYSDKWSSYLEVYWQIFEPLRNTSQDIFEIGVQNGGSLEVWAKFFQQAGKIIGYDIDPKCRHLKFDDPRISVLIGDASADQARQQFQRETSALGIVIDDGSHTSKDVIKTFLQIFPLLEAEGVYVIEDLHTSYWKELGGGISSPESSMQFLKLLADVVNFEHWGVDSPRTDLFGNNFYLSEYLDEKTLEQIDSVQFFNSLCIIRKKSSANLGLGIRLGFGLEAKVATEAIEAQGSYQSPPSQRGNEFAKPSDLDPNRGTTLETQNQNLETQNQNLETQNQNLKTQNQNLETQNQNLKTQNQNLKTQNQNLETQNQNLETQNQNLKTQLYDLKSTLSWRLTKPLRKVRSLFPPQV